MKRLVFCVFAFAAFTFNFANAAVYVRGNDLLRYCADSSTPSEQGLCIGYIEGVEDYSDALSEVRDKHPQCVPAGVEAGQLKDVVVKYLRDNPARRQVFAGVLVYDAIATAWHCK